MMLATENDQACLLDAWKRHNRGKQERIPGNGTIRTWRIQRTSMSGSLNTSSYEPGPLPGIVGNSVAMQQVYQLTRQVARSSASVLLLGETGTGKELIANAIHELSERTSGPFVKVNCGALSESLLESELFGHARGAFTSADSVKIGLMESANKGSFFFDEVCETPLTTQVKLLRVLQERQFNRVGGTKPIKMDVRIIAATNRNLTDAVKNKRFREDLYYRLNVIPIYIPPLTERKEDIPLLVEGFIDKYNKQHKRKVQIRRIHPEALGVLEKYSWPGNVRELENVIERAVVLEKDDVVKVSSLPEEIIAQPIQTVGFTPSFDQHQTVDLEGTLSGIEKKMIVGALEQTGGIMNKAAKLLNLSFRSIRYRIQKHNIKGKFEI